MKHRIALVAGKTYKNIEFLGSCFRDAIFRLVFVNDPSGVPVETELLQFIVGPGQFTFSAQMDCLEFVAPATSPVLRLRAKNHNAPADMRGFLSILQLI